MFILIVAQKYLVERSVKWYIHGRVALPRVKRSTYINVNAPESHFCGWLCIIIKNVRYLFFPVQVSSHLEIYEGLFYLCMNIIECRDIMLASHEYTWSLVHTVIEGYSKWASKNLWLNVCVYALNLLALSQNILRVSPFLWKIENTK